MNTMETIADNKTTFKDLEMSERIIRIPSRGMKWWISNEVFESLKCNEEQPNKYGERYYDLLLPGLTLCVCYRNESFITIDSVSGYIGLSKHDDGWHLGTPVHALSQPLIDAMTRLRGTLK